jgi:hypothetical protein
MNFGNVSYREIQAKKSAGWLKSVMVLCENYGIFKSRVSKQMTISDYCAIFVLNSHVYTSNSAVQWTPCSCKHAVRVAPFTVRSARSPVRFWCQQLLCLSREPTAAVFLLATVVHTGRHLMGITRTTEGAMTQVQLFLSTCCDNCHWGNLSRSCCNVEVFRRVYPHHPRVAVGRPSRCSSRPVWTKSLW